MKFTYNDNGELDDCYINIGTEKSCLFIPISKHLISVLKRYPLLYYAVEEGLICAQNKYYAGGIMSISQIILQFNKKTPAERHKVAHEILIQPPSRENYTKVIEKLNEIALSTRNKELQKVKDKKIYNEELYEQWKALKKPPPVETDAE